MEATSLQDGLLREGKYVEYDNKAYVRIDSGSIDGGAIYHGIKDRGNLDVVTRLIMVNRIVIKHALDFVSYYIK